MSFSNFWELEILDHILNDGAYTAPTNIFVALSTTTPADDATGITEPVGNGYARVSTAGTDWDAAAAGAKSNGNAITFPQATGSWGTVTHVLLYDALTVGNMLAFGALSASKAITTDDTAQFAAGDLTVSLD